MTKYVAQIERKITKTLILTYEFDTEESFEEVKNAIRNGEIDDYDMPIDEDYLQEDFKDSLLSLEVIEK